MRRACAGLHQQFGRSLADCFLGHFRRRHAQDTDLPTALSEAYRSAIDQRLLIEEKYPKGYLDRMKGPLRGLASTLANDLALQSDWSAPAARISAAPEINILPTEQTQPNASSNYCQTLKNKRSDICTIMMNRYNASLRSITINHDNPENATRDFKHTYTNAFKERLFHFSLTEKDAASALHAAHNNAMKSAVAVAVDVGFFEGEVRFHDLGAFRSELNAMCNHINLEIRLGATP